MVVFSPALEVKIDLTLRLTPEQLAQGLVARLELLVNFKLMRLMDGDGRLNRTIAIHLTYISL